MAFRKKLRIPGKIDEDVAEFLGILTGDGCVNKYVRISDKKRIDYYISITGNSITDKEYYDRFLIPLIKKLFDISPKYYKKKGQNTIELMLRYRELFNFLIDTGFNVGPKDKIDILPPIEKNNDLAKAFLRGLFDTDGSISWKKEKYPVISIKQKSRKLIESACKILKKNDFNFYVEFDVKTKDERGFESTGSRVYISGKRNLERWTKVIGSNHPIKNKKMGRLGFEPRTFPA